MDEHEMVQVTQAALGRVGVDEQVLAAAVFHPRGYRSAAFVGGMAGAGVGGLMGEAGDTLGATVGVTAGLQTTEATLGQPRFTFIAVTATHLYGFAGRREDGVVQPAELLWTLERDHTQVSVHSRILMSVLELEDLPTGTKLAFEAERSPMFRTKFVLAALHDSGR
jgi:hypothetical protein